MAAKLVFSPDVVLRFRDGTIVVHTTASAFPALEVGHPMLAGWLCQFARPTDPQAVIAALDAGDRAIASQALNALERNGSLVAVATEAPESAESASALSQRHLRLLARSAYELAADLRGLGPEAEHAVAARSGIGIERRLLALLAAVDALRAELATLRAASLASQLAQLGVTEASHGLRLHIGCGKGLLPGWINVDVHPAPLSMNVLWGLPFDAGSVDFAFVSHLLEHLFFPRDVRALLADLHRVLAPGGIVRIVVPDIEQCIAAYVGHDASFFGSRRETWSWWPENATRLEDFLAYAGVGPEPGHLFEAHKYGYDLETLTRVLSDAGFVDVVRSEFMASAHEPLRVDAVSAVAGARYGDRYYSLFVEARRP